MINRAGARHVIDVQKDANVRLKDRSKRVEGPAVKNYLLLVFLLRAEDDLHGVNSLLLTFGLVRHGGGYYRGRKTAEKTCVVRRTWGSVLIYVRRHIGDDARLIRAHGLNNTENLRVDLPKTIADDVVDHFLPAVLTPRFPAIVLTRIGNVLHDALHSPCK
jgi:hypothetical protein